MKIFYKYQLLFKPDLSVNGHPNSDRQNDQQYEYYYYDDDYYYTDELTGNRNTQAPAAAVPNTKSPAKTTENQPDSLSDAKEAIAQYDIDELVKAWREYMEEKEEKDNQNRAPSSRYTSYSIFKL